MPPLKAGSEVDAWCTRCKLDLLHRIVAMVGTKPVKVECRTCKSVHTYRAPKTGPALAAKAPASASSPRAPASRRPVPADHVSLTPPATATIHPYVLADRYMKDQWIRHKTFGVGLVLGDAGPGKIEVRFDAGEKTLVHGFTP